MDVFAEGLLVRFTVGFLAVVALAAGFFAAGFLLFVDVFELAATFFGSIGAFFGFPSIMVSLEPVATGMMIHKTSYIHNPPNPTNSMSTTSSRTAVGSTSR